jgi:uncharacterized membrane protein YoaK (UPF0700 family)
VSERESDVAESISTSAMVAGAGGFLDAFTYIGHGHVFANAMTANVVLLGVALAAAHLGQARRHLVPILAFIAGVVFARLLQLPPIAQRIGSPYLACTVIEIVFLFAVGWLPATFSDEAITLGMAFVGSIQLATFSTVRGAAYASTFTSGNLRKFSESAFAMVLSPNDAAIRTTTIAFAALCLAFFVGAAIGSVCVATWHNAAAWVDDGWLLIILARFVTARNRVARAAGSERSASS